MSEKKNTASGAKRQKNMLKKQRIAVIILIVAVALLVAALFAVRKIVENIPLEFTDPNDNVLYYIKKVDGEYALYTEAGELCEVTDKNYYVTAYGTLVYINEKTGEYYVDPGRELIFPQLFYDAYDLSGNASYPADRIINKVTVSNMEGEFSFVRDKLDTFILEGHPDVQFTNEAFVYLTMVCAYPLSTMKLESPVTLPDGGIDWSQYGLTTEQRVKTETGEDGEEIEIEYTYSPARVTLSAADGKEYTLYFGDSTVTGASYYVKYEGKDDVFILAGDAIASYILKGVESVITPSIVHPMGSTDYVQVEDFIIYENIDYSVINTLMYEKFGDFDRETATEDEIKAYDAYYAELFDIYSDKACHFSFQDLEARQNSMYATLPYVSFLEYSSGYYINSTNVSMMLQNFYETDFVCTEKLAPSSEELSEYGLLSPERVITFDYLYTNSEGKDARVSNKVYISAQNPDGSYYAYSDMYDMIVCVAEASFNFLEWNELDWYDPAYMQFNINHVTNIKIEAPKVDLSFSLDNSQTPDGNFFPILADKFNDSKENTYEIKTKDGLYSVFSNGELLSPIYSSDYLITGIPFNVGTAQGENYILSEVQATDTDGDDVSDAYVYYYYNVTLSEGKYCLYATLVGVNSAGEQISEAQSVIMEVSYSSDCFVTGGFSQYAFLVPKGSSVGRQLDGIYTAAGKGAWLSADIFITAKGQYILVDGETGIWAPLSSISNPVYLADKNSGKLQASGIDIDAYGVGETVYCNTGESISYNDETRMLQLYNKATGVRRDANKVEVAPGIWGRGDIYLSLSGELISLDRETGEANTIQLKDASYLASVYESGKELTYTYSVTDSLGKTQQKLAIYNFQQFYTGLLFGSFEGICELSEEEMSALRELDSFTGEDADERCILRMTVNALDAKGNQRNLVYRFYRISERRAYITIESLDSATAASDSTKAYGSFYVLSSYVEKLISDARKVVDGVAVEANSKY